MEPGDLRTALDRTERYIERERFRGYDPYDALTSPMFRMPVLRSARLPRFGFQQVIKRLPFQTRPLFGIGKGYNPVTLALVLQGYAYREEAAGERTRTERIDHLVSELDRLASPGWSGLCWGYDFPWQSRYASYQAFHPTVVATGFVTNALFEAWSRSGVSRAGELVTLGAEIFARVSRSPGAEVAAFARRPTPWFERALIPAIV